jgi:hypothetical protein
VTTKNAETTRLKRARAAKSKANKLAADLAGVHVLLPRLIERAEDIAQGLDQALTLDPARDREDAKKLRDDLLKGWPEDIARIERVADCGQFVQRPVRSSVGLTTELGVGTRGRTTRARIPHAREDS